MSSDAPAVISGTAKVGATLTCQSPTWIRQPERISFAFDSYRFNQGRVDAPAGRVSDVRRAKAGRRGDSSRAGDGLNGGGFETTEPSAALRIAGW